MRLTWIRLTARTVALALLALAVLVTMGSPPSTHADGGENGRWEAISDRDAHIIYEGNTRMLYTRDAACRLRANNPHYSHHSTSPRINQTSTIRCSESVYFLRVATELQRYKCFLFYCWWGRDARVGKSDPKYNGTFVRAHSNRTCKDGKYRGQATQVMRLTPTSNTVIVRGYSREVTIRCR
ncbi:MAG: hypothetical protein OXL97_12370 [Chloroflexota bacterium]|nr:hypothetical protein [Chloroflexota bacterium]MDE2883874.1 hypothetical protein [Chloroflexota bacterium]